MMSTLNAEPGSLGLLFAAMEIKSGVVFFAASALVAWLVTYIVFRKPKNQDGKADGGDLEL
jgi:hypothetical protein